MTNRFSQTISNRRGFTLVETTVVALLSGLLTFAIASVVSSTNRNMKSLSDLGEDTFENVVAERQILSDMRGAFPSFNTLDLNDDDGKPFFDLFFDVPSALIPAGDRKRTFTLGPDPAKKQVKEFIILVARGSAVLYDPVAAYQVDPPTTAGAGGVLTYRGVNFNNIVSADPTGFFPKQWIVGDLFFLYSPVGLRPTGAVDFTKPSRWHSYLGKVSGNNLIQEVVSSATLRTTSGQLIRDTYPLNPALRTTDADSFFVRVPAAAGSAAPVFLMPVTLVKYTVEPNRYRGRDTNKLVRRIWEKGAFQTVGQDVLLDFERLIFIRSSVTLPSLSVDIKRVGES